MTESVHIPVAPPARTSAPTDASAPETTPRPVPLAPIPPDRPRLSLAFAQRDFESFPLAPLLAQIDRQRYDQALAYQRHVREYTERYLWPNVVGWDARAAEDHTFFPWEAFDAGARYGFLSDNVPKLFGGRGRGLLEMMIFAEEISAADGAFFVNYGAHGLALSVVSSSLDPRTTYRVLNEIVEGDRSGKPVLLSLAITEPTAGSDVEDEHDLKRAKLVSRWKKVAGGYRINARKMFISGGSVSRYCVVVCWGDHDSPHTTGAGFIVPTDAPGFSVGRVERKMGQRLCPAAEIVCDDVFVPDADAFVMGDDVLNLGRVTDSVLSMTRGPVGAHATGIARGALERTLHYLSEKRCGDRWLFDEQWVQLALADMVGSIQAGRGLYMDAALAQESWGLISAMGANRATIPAFIRSTDTFRRIINHPATRLRVRQRVSAAIPREQLSRLNGISSTAKFFGGDLAVSVCMRAMDILGEDANDPKWGVEKCMRDAKLTQIFEGTNQLNRLHVTRGLITRR